MLAEAALSVLVATTSPEQRLTQLHAATAVWLIRSDVRLQGEFVREQDGERVGIDVFTKMTYEGSAVAVTPDGLMLTARHVVDPLYLTACACKTKLREYALWRVDSARIDVTFSDVAGEPLHGVITLTPRAGETNLCNDAIHAVWSVADGSAVRIERMDDLADLALVKAEVTDIPFLPVTLETPAAGTPVYALGYDGRLVRTTGDVASPCDNVLEEPDEDDILIMAQPEPLTRTTVPVHAGMSGGPLLSGGTVVGINVKGESECAGANCVDTAGDAVPAGYFSAWYLWARGLASRRPQLCVPVSAP